RFATSLSSAATANSLGTIHTSTTAEGSGVRRRGDVYNDQESVRFKTRTASVSRGAHLILHRRSHPGLRPVRQRQQQGHTYPRRLYDASRGLPESDHPGVSEVLERKDRPGGRVSGVLSG